MMSAMALAANKVREAMRQVGQAWQPCTLGETKDVVEVTNHWEGKTSQVETWRLRILESSLKKIVGWLEGHRYQNFSNSWKTCLACSRWKLEKKGGPGLLKIDQQKIAFCHLILLYQNEAFKRLMAKLVNWCCKLNSLESSVKPQNMGAPFSDLRDEMYKQLHLYVLLITYYHISFTKKTSVYLNWKTNRWFPAITVKCLDEISQGS